MAGADEDCVSEALGKKGRMEVGITGYPRRGGSTAIASRPAVRATSLFTAEATPAWLGRTLRPGDDHENGGPDRALNDLDLAPDKTGASESFRWKTA
jgi:hypothetical protein